MSNVQTSAEREIVDLSHLAFDCGMIGRLKTVSWTPVIEADSTQFQKYLVAEMRHRWELHAELPAAAYPKFFLQTDCH